jgi:hypothetical protein
MKGTIVRRMESDSLGVERVGRVKRLSDVPFAIRLRGQLEA